MATANFSLLARTLQVLQHALLWVPSSSDFFSFVARAPTSYFPVPRGSVSHFPTRCEGKRGFSDNFLFFFSFPFLLGPFQHPPQLSPLPWKHAKGLRHYLTPLFLPLPVSAMRILACPLFSSRFARGGGGRRRRRRRLRDDATLLFLPPIPCQTVERTRFEREKRETVREASTHLPPPPKKKRRTPFASKRAAAQSARQHKKIKREMGRRPPFRSLSPSPFRPSALRPQFANGAGEARRGRREYKFTRATEAVSRKKRRTTEGGKTFFRRSPYRAGDIFTTSLFLHFWASACESARAD